jgi:hypothetical protein
MPPYARIHKDAPRTAIEGLDALMQEIDPEVLLAGALGAVAASRGIVPPMTRLLMTFSSNIDIKSDLERMAGAVVAGPIGLASGVWGSLTAAMTGKTPEGEGVPVDQYALAASGALEAMMMMSLVKNPGLPELIGKLVDKIPSVSV